MERLNIDHNINTSDLSLKGGDILVSSPLLNDPNFRRSVVLILERDRAGGYLGLVINHPLDLTLAEICQVNDAEESIRVFCGGPVDMQRLFWIHSFGTHLNGALEVLPGLWVGGDYDLMISRLASEERIAGSARFFLGYSGWTSGQLEREIKAGAWGVLSNLLDPGLLIQENPDSLWTTLARRLGPDYKHWLMLPPDPSLN
ncbi:MAG: YqgE/AlgH family protein [Muribaculaceae bacterium]|nr:YqgE/AlgH family protein [Muribaculaceae bacterium]